MKKIGIFILFIFIVCGCTAEKIEVNVPIENEIIPEKEEEVIPIYKDENEVKVGIYDNNHLVTQYAGLWNRKQDIVWFNIAPTNNEIVERPSSKTTWKTYWENYDNQGYKFGSSVEFTLASGKTIQKTIITPSDAKSFYDYLEIYYYDGYHTTESWFDHLEDDEIRENTVFTSIKLTSGSKIDEIASPITFTVFTYDSLDDFDENNVYRGNSKHSVIVNKK